MHSFKQSDAFLRLHVGIKTIEKTIDKKNNLRKREILSTEPV